MPSDLNPDQGNPNLSELFEERGDVGNILGESSDQYRLYTKAVAEPTALNIAMAKEALETVREKHSVYFVTKDRYSSHYTLSIAAHHLLRFAVQAENAMFPAPLTQRTAWSDLEGNPLDLTLSELEAHGLIVIHWHTCTRWVHCDSVNVYHKVEFHVTP